MAGLRETIYTSFVPEQIKLFLKNFNNASDMLVSTKQSVTSAFTRTFEFTEDNMLEIMLLFADLGPSIWKQEDIHMGRILHISYRLAKLFQVEKAIVDALLQNLLSERKRIQGVEAQGYDIDSKTIFNTLMNWSAFVGTLILGCAPSVLLTRRVTDSLRLLDIAFKITSSSQIKDLLKDCLPNFVLTWLDLDVPAIVDEYTSKIMEIRKFIITHQQKRTVFYNTAETRNFKRFATWLDEELLSLAVDRTVPYSLVQMLRDCRMELDKLKGDFINEDFDPHPFEPFCIYLTGNPGCGKSTISKYIASKLNHETMKVRASDLLYIKNPGDPYATGYRGQFTWIYDDFGQNLAGDDGLELIKFITPQKAPLNMPSLNDPTVGIKGTLNTSMLFICCSNLAYPLFPNLASADALWRRRHVLVEMRAGPSPLDATFVLMDPLKEARVISQPMNFEQLLNYLSNAFHNHIEKQKRLKDQFTKYLIQQEGEEFVDAAQPIAEQNFEQVKMDISKTFTDYTKKIKDFLGVHKQLMLKVCAAMIGMGSIYFAGKKVSQFMDDRYQQKEDDKAVAMSKLTFPTSRGLFRGGYDHCEQREKYWLTKQNEAKARDMAILKDEIRQTNLKNVGVDQKEINEIKAKNNGSLDDNIAKYHAEGSSAFFSGRRKNRKFKRYDEECFQTPADVIRAVSRQNRAYDRYDDNCRMEGVEDQIADNVVTSISKQVIEIMTTIVTGDEKRCVKMHALPVVDNIVLAPRHLFMYQGQYLPKGSLIDVYCNWSYPTSYFDVNNIIEFQENNVPADIVLYRLGTRVRTFRKITQMFVSEDELNKIFFTAGSLISRKDGVVRSTFTQDAKLITSDVIYDASGVRQELGDVVAYEIPTSKGDCGGPFIAYNNMLKGKILGIHIAGDVNRALGFCKLVTREMLEEKLVNFKNIVDGCGIAPIQREIIQAQGSDWTIDLPYVGKMTKKNFVPEKTKYVQSYAFELAGPHESEPAILHPNDPRGNGESPLLNGVAKYANRTHPIPIDALQFISDSLEIIFAPVIRDHHFVLSEDQAINGVDGLEFCDALNFQSSAGWPYKNDVNINKLKGKDGLFSNVDNRRSVINSLLRERLDARWQEGINGRRIASIWLDTLKDETRALKKIATNSTRVFAIAPVDFTIVLRQLTLTFCASVMRNRIKVPVAVGINPYSLEWTQLAQHLKSVGNCGFACDYTRYDGTMHPELIHLVFELLTKCYKYTNSEESMLSVLENEIIHTIQVARDDCYMTCGGNPSGNNITSILNSIVNVAYVLYAYYLSVPVKFRSTQAFMEHIRLITYGDDNVITVSRPMQAFFGFEQFRKELKNIGVTVTCETKDGKDELWRPIEEMTFLSNGFRKCGSVYYATLKKSAITEMVNWVSNNIDKHIATTDNVNTALRFLYFHGRSEFDAYFKIWRKWAKQSYQQLDDHFTNCGEIKTNIVDYLQEIEAQGLIIAQGNTITTITNQNGWSRVGSNTLPIDVTGDKLDMKFKASSLDKPSCSLAMAPTVLKDFQGISNCTNIDYNNVLALNANTLAITDGRNTQENDDEMSVKWLVSRWGLISNVIETTAWANNQVLIDSIHMDPCCVFNDFTATATGYTSTPLATISAMASFWRGGLEYRFIFLCDGFTSMKICADFRYNIFPKGEADPDYDAERASMYCYIMDVSPHKYMFDVRVPFMSCNAWCTVRNFNTTKAKADTTLVESASLGKIHVSVLNGPTGQTTRAKVRIIVLQRGSHDYQLAGMYSNNACISAEGEEIIGNIGSAKAALGKVSDASGTVVNTLGNNESESRTAFANTLTSMSPSFNGFEQYFGRWQLFKTAATIDTTAVNFDIGVWSYVNGVSAFKSFFDQYMFFRAKSLEIRIEVNGNPYCAGALLCAHMPVNANVDASQKIAEVLVGLQHGFLNYNTTSALTLSLPMAIDSDYINLKRVDSAIRVFGSIIMNFESFKLQKEATTQTPSYTMYARFIEPELKIPTKVKSYAVVAQGLDTVELTDQSVGLTECVTVGEDHPLPEDYTVFDPFLSLRAAVKRFVPFKPFADVVVTLKPGEVQTQILDIRAILIKQGVSRLCNKIFGLYRGGIRLKMRFVPQFNLTAPTLQYGYTGMPIPPAIYVTMNTSASGGPTADSVIENYFSGTSTESVSWVVDATCQTGFIEFEVPFANSNNWRLTSLDTRHSSVPTLYVVFKNNHKYLPVDVTTMCFIAGADDLRFKNFVGLPKFKFIAAEIPDNYA